jgi:seryl-tRNA(Sec) selenium transferase
MLEYTQFTGEPSGRGQVTEFTPPAGPASLSTIIARIEQTVDEETASIRTDMNYDLKASNARKSRYLYELSRAMKGIGAAQLIAEQREAIVRLRDKLAKNESAIRAHLNAVNEVATLIQSAIQRSEADGTYSAGEFGRR